MTHLSETRDFIIKINEMGFTPVSVTLLPIEGDADLSLVFNNLNPI